VIILAELRVTRTKDGVLLSGQLPQEIFQSQTLELFPLRDGAYLLTVKGFVVHPHSAREQKAAAAKSLSEKEKALVRKLLSIRFESRIPAEVGKALSKEEKETLEALLKNEAVQIFHGGKYEKTGVLNVSEAAFAAVREPAAAPSQALVPQLPQNSIAHLEKTGWMVLENDSEARNFGNAFSDKVKSGEVRGQRAFDRKYYFVTKGFFESHEKEVLIRLGKSDKTPEEIAEEAGIPSEGCRAILVHLLEEGEVLEKRKGKFSKA